LANELAITKFASALVIDRQRENSYYNRGVTYFKQRKYDLAIDDFTYIVTKLDVRNANAFYNRGCTYYRQGNEELCISDWKQAVDLGNSDAKKNLKDIYNIDY
jgi:tetratricopeptide (TPR) repeat protein